MQSEPAAKTPDGMYAIKRFTMESSKEHQEWNQFLPPTEELPVTHEHYVRHFTENRNGHDLRVVEVGVRPKLRPAPAQQSADPSDGLDKLDDAGLETKAARVGVNMTEFGKVKSKQKRVEMIRERMLVTA